MVIANSLLGEGSFGCVFQPKIPCESKEKKFESKAKKISKKKEVSKIFVNKDDFDMEMEKSKMAAKVNPKGDLMLLPTSSCTTSNATVSKSSTVINECDALVQSVYNKSKKLYQMNMPYGGERVDKYLKKIPKTRKQFLEDMMPVFEAVVKLQDANICHQDIKPSNMLYTPNGDVILIDYSLMIPINKVYDVENLSVLKHNYLPYPPEYKMFQLFYKKICKGKGDCPYYQEIQDSLKSFGSEKYYNYREYHSDENFRMEMRILYDWTVKNKDSLVNAYSSFAKKVDIYSVGMCMIMVNNLLIDAPLKKESLSFLKGYNKFVYELTHPHPVKRLDAKMAYATVKKLLKIK